jgi:hypothetical protein
MVEALISPTQCSRTQHLKDEDNQNVNTQQTLSSKSQCPQENVQTRIKLEYYTTLVLNYLYFKLYLQIIRRKRQLQFTGETQTIALENNFARPYGFPT